MIKLAKLGEPIHYPQCSDQNPRNPHLGAIDCTMCVKSRLEKLEENGRFERGLNRGMSPEQIIESMGEVEQMIQKWRSEELGEMTLEDRRSKNLWILGDPVFNGMTFK